MKGTLEVGCRFLLGSEPVFFPQYWGDRCWFEERTIPVVSEDGMVVDEGQRVSGLRN